jgi:hypothetical protein
LGPDGAFLYFDVALPSRCGFFRATVRLARTAMEQCGLSRWSVDELAVLYTLQAGVPARYGLRLTASWCDVMGLFGSSPVADKLYIYIYIYAYMCYIYREIMLFIGKPKGRSMMISNATNPLKESRKNLY